MNISQCLNPDCLEKNPPQAKLCQKCGAKILLGDRYRPVGVLGKGGMGRTFIAVDEHRLNTPCVIKQFLPLNLVNTEIEKLIELFKQEAICLRDLGKHPQIPDLEAFFAQEGRFYLIQEFVDGYDLLKELKQKGRFSEQQVRQVFHQILPILHFIHSRNVIHRDIKPSNIIRRKDGSLVLIDFGVSKQLSVSVQTSVGTITGTAGYAPPEQMRGVVFPCSDLYALAATSLRLLTMCLPRPDGKDELYDAVEGVWKWRDKVSVSDNLAYVIDKLLNDVVKQRYQTAAEVWQALNPKPVTLPPKQPINQPQYPVQPTQPRNPNPVISNPTTVTSTPEPTSSRNSRISYRRSGFRSNHPDIPLLSEVGVDYTNLKKLLADRNYKAADQETYNLMLLIAHRQAEEWLRNEDIAKFPCTDLKTIDQLWVEYSKRRFGFSVQKRIYENIESRIRHPKKVWLAFCEEVGWRVDGKWQDYSEIIFALHGPSGHLPCGSPPKDLAQGMIQFELSGSFVIASVISSLVQRMKNCGN